MSSTRILLFCILCLSGMTGFSQESNTGTILIYTNPGSAIVKIPELKFKEKKLNYCDLLLYNVPAGEYNFHLIHTSRSGKGAFMLTGGDTLAVFMNFETGTLLGISAGDLKRSGDELVLWDRIQKTFRLIGDSSCIQQRRDDGIQVTGIEYEGNGKLVLRENFTFLDYDMSGFRGDTTATDLEAYYIVDDMPTFNYGEPAIEFRKYIGLNLRYPEEAASKKITGRVIIQFAIDNKGHVVDVEVMNDAHPLLAAEAIRVVKSSPRWKPGLQRGKPVKVLFTFPISFGL